MGVRKIGFGSDEYRRECELRQRVLRAPLGMNIYDENLDAEREQLHFGLFDGNGELVACVIAVEQPPADARIRQMAVAPAQQGKGYGRMLLEDVEAKLAMRGLTHLSLHARMSAAGFYERLGYAPSGDEYIEVGLPHVTMCKRLTGRQP